jgi:aminobenzoyl-glutamate utilization protein B
VKKLIESGLLTGTVVFLGCPAEESLLGKGLMARNGAFDDLDFNVSFHPGTHNNVMVGNLTGVNSFKLHFKGRTAHAGGAPQNGRSALDALELTHVGINYLREHVTNDVRMHYVNTEGGTAPNIVPDKASGWYYVRALKREVVEDVYNRMLDCARGAALMTGTEVEVELLGGCYPTLNNHVLANTMRQIMCDTPQEPWTQEEQDFAAALDGAERKYHLHTGVTPLATKDSYGSTDAGDVEHICPGIFFQTACCNASASGHTWQNTAAYGSSIGMKGMMYAARVMAIFGAKVMGDPELLAAAKAEFAEKTGGKPYICPIPADAVPAQD